MVKNLIFTDKNGKWYEQDPETGIQTELSEEPSNKDLLDRFEVRLGEFMVNHMSNPFKAYKLTSQIFRQEVRPSHANFEAPEFPYVEIFTHGLWLVLWVVEVDCHD